MPIRPQHRWLYPIDWVQLSALVRFERAGGRCQGCRRPHGQLVCHLGDGRWWDHEGQVWRDGQGRRISATALPSPADPTLLITKVVLAAAHLDHDPTNNRLRNLKAFCQRCHMIHDAPEHRRRRWLTLQARKALGDLFLGPYPSPRSLLIDPERLRQQAVNSSRFPKRQVSPASRRELEFRAACTT